MQNAKLRIFEGWGSGTSLSMDFCIGIDGNNMPGTEHDDSDGLNERWARWLSAGTRADPGMGVDEKRGISTRNLLGEGSFSFIGH
jgi:hypothetical protein